MSCIKTLKGIAQSCEGNLGGILEVYLANKDNVSATPGSVTDPITSAVTEQITGITLSNSETFKKYYVRKGTSSMTKEVTVNENGSTYVTTSLNLVFARMDAAKRLEMNALAQADLVALVKDANGIVWFLGFDDAVTMSAGGGETGTARGDNNQYTTTLSDESANFPYTVTPAAFEAAIGA